MDAEILHIQECPSWEHAGRNFAVALERSGHGDVEIRYTLLSSPAETERVAFAGSPTILLDGVDLFPGAPHVSELACRVYPTPEGLRGSPTAEQFEAALLALR